MKKILLISAFFISSSIMFGQFTIHYTGALTNHPATPVMMYLEVDSVIVDSTLTTPSTANYFDSLNVTTRPFMIRVLFYDCTGAEVADWYSPAPAVTFYNITYTTLNYCTSTPPPPPCNASFTKHQAVDSLTGLAIPNKVIIVDGSTGSALTYSWDFGDGSAPLSGLNVTHTYATHGSYNVCLTVVSSTAIGTCTSIFCDTLTVDSSGTVRSAFTVTTGNSIASVDEKKSINGLTLYPNPAQEFINLDFEAINSSDLNVRIYDTKGSVVQVFNKFIHTGSNKIQINTSVLKEGLYIIQLQDGESFVTKRFQVVK
ncbi:PKD domain-containing protein [Flavobacteriales bacterium]|nr:PKD domain-containing protein [Flavobacteriales bacterium]